MYTLTIGKRIILKVASLEEASDFYCNLRDQSGEGSSTFPIGKIKKIKNVIAEVSYNGRIWQKTSGLLAA
jgi:hypothetical protein